MELKLLNETQKESARDLIKHYKFVYVCNLCGLVYGSDLHEKHPMCPKCESKIRKQEVKD